MEDICSSHHHGHRNSTRAFKAGDKQSWNTRVFQYIDSQFFDGATPEECAAELGARVTTIRPRFSELKAQGRIVETKIDRPSEGGEVSTVCVATDFAE